MPVRVSTGLPVAILFEFWQATQQGTFPQGVARGTKVF
jgi:hypothetical protein